jgi:hypothetical protein
MLAPYLALKAGIFLAFALLIFIFAYVLPDKRGSR